MATRVLLDTAAPAGRSDAALVAAAKADSAQFLALYERYVPRVQRYVRIRVGDRAACEDVTSEIFLAALAKLGDFRGSGSFAAWLFRIAQNAVHDQQRSRQFAPVDDVLDALPDPAVGPEEQALRNERLARLRGCIAGLTHEQQDLLALRYGAELASDEIGLVVGKNAVAVRVALHRTLNTLRRRYLDET